MPMRTVQSVVTDVMAERRSVCEHAEKLINQPLSKPFFWVEDWRLILIRFNNEKPSKQPVFLPHFHDDPRLV